MKKSTSSLLAAASFVLISAVMTPLAWAAPVGDIKIAIGADPDSFDPLVTSYPAGFTVNLLTMNGLFRLDARNSVQKDLATSYSYSADGKLLTVKMVTGRQFSNGDPLNAEAVAASFNRLLDPANGSAYAGLYKTLGRARAIGADTVEFELSSPNGHALMLLASTTGSIVNVKSAKEMGANYGRYPVGSGPYIVKDFVGGERFTLVPNPKYNGSSPAKLAKIEFVTVPETGSRMALLETGEADVVERVPPQSIAAINALPGAKAQTFSSNFSINMELVSRGPLADKRVREAMNLAVDRPGMTKGVLGGLGTPSVGMVGPGTQDDLRVTFPEIRYDPQQAKTLLAQAGYKPGQISVTMTCPNGRYINDAQACQALQAQWQAIGINVKADIVDRGTWGKVIAMPPDTRKDNLAIVGRASAGIDFTLYRLFHSTSGINTTGFSNPKVDELLAKGRASTDPAAQKAIYGEIQKIVWDERAFVFLWYQKQVLGVSNKVKGLQVRPDETLIFDDVTISK